MRRSKIDTSSIHKVCKQLSVDSVFSGFICTGSAVTHSLKRKQMALTSPIFTITRLIGHTTLLLLYYILNDPS